tara:strand:- start:4735 stop:5139 length:405 start_codon:yes stop_codon:yes gene_type:complete
VTGYLLDTNILSDLIRSPGGIAARRLAEVGEDQVATSVIVAAELRYGIARKGSARLTARVEALLSEIAVLPFELPADAAYREIRSALEAAGTPIGGNDMLIAAHAFSLKRTMVTANTREFERVKGLIIENWLDG